MAKSKKSLKRKQRKKQARSVRNRRRRHALSGDVSFVPDYLAPPSVPAICPLGFRIVSSSQATHEFGSLVLREFERQKGRGAESLEELETLIDLTVLCWNYTLSATDKRLASGVKREIEQEVERGLACVLPTPPPTAEFLSLIVDRYNHLFPEELNPKGAPYFVVRNEDNGPIEPVDHAQWSVDVSGKAPTDAEQEFLSNLHELDNLFREDHKRADQSLDELDKELEDEPEALLFDTVVGLGADLFETWLTSRHLPPFDSVRDVFLQFMSYTYQYVHEERHAGLAAIHPAFLIDFLYDSVYDNALFTPNDLMKFPVVLIALGVWLEEIGYLVDHRIWTRAIDAQTEEFYAEIERCYRFVPS